jgi:hypothetical protein
MDWLTFISKIVDALAWPLVIVGLLFFLRKELPNIVRSLRKLKFKDVEMEFGEAAKALAEETKRAVPNSKPDEDEHASFVDPEEAKLKAIAEYSPRAAILEAWLQVESATAEFLRAQGAQGISSVAGPLRLLERLRTVGVLTPPQESAYEHLRQLRNQAVHAPDAEFTASAVSNYIESALSMAAYLKDMAQIAR